MKIFQRFKESFRQFLERRFYKIYSANCYLSIDELPVWYWWMIHKENNLSYLIRTKSVHISKKKPSSLKQYALAQIWKDIMNQYLSRHGFSENYLDYIRKQKEIAQYRIQRLVNDDKTMNAYIEIAEMELEELQKEMKGGNFFELKAFVEREMGFSIDPMRTTAGEFYSYFEIVKKKPKKKINSE